jgi:hypothetical protein
VRELDYRDGWEEKTERGRDADRAQALHYRANQVRLSNGKVLDSYEPSQEIVSRKTTQLSKLADSTLQAIIDEFYDKYPPGEIIADTPTARAEYPKLIGEPLKGRWILEVEPQQTDPPQDFVDQLERLGITLRDFDFKVLTGKR